MELDSLKYFITIANTQNITLAADELNISPSALSNGLQKLEKELGYPLFERTSKGMKLTDNGSFFLEWAKKNAQFELKLADKLSESAKDKGTLKVGISVESDTLFIMLSVFQKRYPDIKIELYDQKSLLDNYLVSDLDCFVVAKEDKKDQPGILLAQRTHLFVLMRESHSLAQRESLTLEDLKDQRFVFSSYEGKIEWTYDYCCQNGFNPNVQYLCEDFDGKVDIITKSDTLGIGYNTMRLLRESMCVKAIPLVSETPMNEEFYFVWRKEQANPLVQLLAAFAIEFDKNGRAAYLK